MVANRRGKVLLIQLPFPYFPFRKYWGNIPLAAGYLKAMAYREGLLHELEIEILDQKATNLSGDARLIDLITLKAPDILGFSLYSWNSIRSLFIAQEVKKRLPHLKILVGGAEVTTQTQYILKSPVVDIGCIGEGELTFVEIMKNILHGRRDYANIDGLFYKKHGQIIVTPPRQPIRDLDLIPSPYILGFINPREYGEVWLENMRGCPFKCTYCAHGIRSIGYFSAQRIQEELKECLAKGIGLVRFVNGTLTAYPDFGTLCQRIKEVNVEKKLEFFAFTYAEHINEKVADRLKECNFTHLEIGLQSIHSSTLKEIHRKADQRNFLAGIKLLNERNINFTIDIIIALPNERLRDFKKTFQFLRDHGIRIITPFVLFLLPGTPLRKDASKYGIKYQRKPPYLTTETPYISKEGIQKAISLVKGERTPWFFGTTATHCTTDYPIPMEKIPDSPLKLKNFNFPINKIILETDSSVQNAVQFEQLGKKLRRLILQPLTVWVKSKNVEKDFPLIKSFLLPIATSNPFLLWSIILETDHDFPMPILARTKRTIPSKEMLFDFCETSDVIKMAVIVPWNNHHVSQAFLNDITKRVPLYWSLNIVDPLNWKRNIENVFRYDYGKGALVEFSPTLEFDFVVRALKYLYQKNNNGKKIFFRNLAFSYTNFPLRIDKLHHIPLIRPKYIESILSLDKNMNIVSSLIPSPKVMVDIMEYQIRFHKFEQSGQSGTVRKV